MNPSNPEPDDLDADDDLTAAEDEVDVDALRASSQAGEDVEPSDAGDAESDARARTISAPARALRRQAPPNTASLLDMVEGRSPIFVVHKSYQHSQHIPELLGTARRRVRARAGLGVALRLPKMAPDAASAYLDSCTAATMKIADPEIHTITGAGSPTSPPAKAAQRYRWRTAIPDSSDSVWVRDVLQSQADAGANVFLSASGWVPETNGRAPLSTAMDWVRLTRSELADEPMFVNLTMRATWITDPSLRAALKQEIVESNERMWWLRFYWPIVEPRYGQLTDPAILDGYRDLATTAALEEKVLVLPNSGLTGWMATAWGAQGFSTGTSWTEQMYGEQPVRRSTPGKPKPPPVERFFDRSILHNVPHTVHLSLAAEPNHVTCSCRFCRRLMQAPAYDQPTANLHYLLECANLTATLNGHRPSLRALRIVRDARAFVASATTPPTGQGRPLHLGEWEARLP